MRDGQVPAGVHDEVVTFSKVLFVVRWNACVVHVDANGGCSPIRLRQISRLCFQAHLRLKSHIPVACKEMNASVLCTVRVLELCRSRSFCVHKSLTDTSKLPFRVFKVMEKQKHIHTSTLRLTSHRFITLRENRMSKTGAKEIWHLAARLPVPIDSRSSTISTDLTNNRHAKSLGWIVSVLGHCRLTTP